MVSESDSQSSGSSPALITCWICSQWSHVESLATLVNSQLLASYQVGVFNPVMLYLNYFFSKYTSGVPVN